MIGESFIERLTLTRPLDKINIGLLQKYIGYLLINQRKTLKIPVLNGLGKKLDVAKQILADDLKKSKIINVGYIKEL